MAAPEGYTELGRIGFVDKGNYASGTTYRTGDVVYYNGSTWVALKDNLRGVTPAPGANWKYMARGFAAEALSAVTAKDTSGVLGTAGASVTSQALVDAIADKVMTKLIEKSKIVNNLLATDATTVLSGPMGKSLDEKIGKVISDFAKVATIVRATTPNITVADNDVIMSITLYDGTWLVSAYAGGNKVLIQDNATPHLSYRHGTNPVDFVIASSELNYQLVNKSGGNIQTYGDGSNFYLIAIRIK